MSTVTSTPMPEAGIATFDELFASLSSAVNHPAAMTATQAAKYLDMSKSSLYRGLASGEIPRAVETPGGPRWRRKDLDAYLASLKPRR